MLEVATEASSSKPNIIDTYIKPETLYVGSPAAEFVKYVRANPLSVKEYCGKEGADASYKECRPCNIDPFSLTSLHLAFY